MQYHIIDVFTDKLFGGNPAGVCILDKWLPDDTLQNIAAENNLSETAFLVKRDDYYDLRWFTPAIEVDLCGHATVASAFVLFDEIEKAVCEIKFKTMSGVMAVSKMDDLLYLDFPSRPVTSCPMYLTFEKAFGIKPVAVYKAVDFLVLVILVFEKICSFLLVFFPPCFVVVLALRQQGCVLRLTGRKNPS